MCPVCLAASGLYIAGGLSAGAVTTFLATKLLRKRPEAPRRRSLRPASRDRGPVVNASSGGGQRIIETGVKDAPGGPMVDLR